MTPEELDVVRKLATAFSMTRAEIDAMRTVVVAAVATINAHPELRADFAARLQAAKEADVAASLASTMTDEMLQQRADWLRRLVPPELQGLMK